jgi:hypothetical protein
MVARSRLNCQRHEKNVSGRGPKLVARSQTIPIHPTTGNFWAQVSGGSLGKHRKLDLFCSQFSLERYISASARNDGNDKSSAVCKIRIEEAGSWTMHDGSAVRDSHFRINHGKYPAILCDNEGSETHCIMKYEKRKRG